MDRITDKDLQALAARLNAITGSPATAWRQEVDAQGRSRNVANVGNFHISHAYGGVCLHRMSNTGGGVHTVLSYGHVPKRELYNQMRAYIAGMEQAPAAQEQRA
jgi:hypothetical protein